MKKCNCGLLHNLPEENFCINCCVDFYLPYVRRNHTTAAATSDVLERSLARRVMVLEDKVRTARRG